MPTVYEAIDATINEATLARKRVAKIQTSQVRGVDEIASLKATAQTWFHTHRPVVVTGIPVADLAKVDVYFTAILNATSKSAAKTTYLSALKGAKAALLILRTTAIATPPPTTDTSTDDIAPDFSPLAGNQQMRDILSRRWNECAKCVSADAHLAGIVMMGGLLEALFVSRANKMPDKTPLVSATNAPRDKTGKIVNYQEWMLDSYIKVGFELGWITESAKDIADKLKEYRNFVHPAKELRYGVTLGLNDSSMFWQVTKALARQLLLSA
jgi:hypothetical protein